MNTTVIPLAIASLLLASCKPSEKSPTAAAAEKTPAAAATSDAAKPYPLDVCLVSGEKLGEMGEPVVITHEGQQIKFCCKSCVPKFEKEPAKYLAKLK
jgi:YHS domain-containing protein